MSEIILSALVTTSLLISIFQNHDMGTIVAAILSTILLVIQIYTKDYDLQKSSKDHAVAAHQLWNIRELYISLLADIKSGIIKVDDIKTQRDELQQQLNLIYKNAPRTNAKAYIQAGKALNQNGKINQGEEMTLSDE
ncbi:MAG: SLATT domain-containing protein [Moorea sp. SIO4A1]|nr:SLATT domain-containing protein [Moorena sp. SIO4A5]NEQ60237.1 SLATT domain-containing protein [Moorena sp. SIO4A1]